MKIQNLLLNDTPVFSVGNYFYEKVVSEIIEFDDFYEVHYKDTKFVSRINKAFVVQVDLVEVDE
jgi:hypothetical protein